MSVLEIPLTTRVPTRGLQPKLVWFHGKNSWGKNPDGRSLYRVIRSESRFALLGGCWPDGAIEYRWAPYYGARKEWVLEKWLSAEEYAGSKADWERDNIDYDLAVHGISVFTMGQYPSTGWYEHCYSFPEGQDPNLDLIVPLLEQTKELTFAQIKAGVQLCHEKMRKDWERKVEDGIDDASAAFGNRASSVAPSKPQAEHINIGKPEELAAAVRKYRGDDQKKETPEFEELPTRGFSMPQRKRGA